MYQAIIIGAGHAGLATAYLLRKQGIKEIAILEKTKHVGSAWRKRYEGLTLFTSKQFCQLPGLNMNGNSSDYPTKDEFVTYLEHYQATFQFNILFQHQVSKVEKIDGGFVINCSNGQALSSQRVFVCTGAFSSPIAPTERHNSFTPESLGNQHLQSKDKRWLVIGDGASGRQIAKQLAVSNMVYLSQGKKRYLMPQKLLGRDIFYWHDLLAVTRLAKSGWLAKHIRKRDPFPNSGIDEKTLKALGITLLSRFDLNLLNEANIIKIDNQKIDFIVYALGYRNYFQFLGDLVDVNEYGELRLENGNTKTPGLYVLSQPWLSNRGSGLILGVAHDFKLLQLN